MRNYVPRSSWNISNYFLILGHSLEELCTVMLWKQLPDGTPTLHDEKYYLLGDILPKDKELREKLQKKKLEFVLSQHQFERTDSNFVKECLYCRDVLEPTRYKFVEHLFIKHFLQLGKPENLVFIDELVKNVETKLNNLICVYCEKVFKDRATLKEHMRKKGHKRINPENKAYDKYFLINYKLDKWEPKTQERKFYNPRHNQPHQRRTPQTSVFNSDDNSSDWSDWDGEKETEIICLFCAHSETGFEELKDHMKIKHSFHFDLTCSNFNFYHKVKMVNYIRRKVHLKQCIKCEKSCESSEALLEHMETAKHRDCNETQWEKPEYFFPTFEDDNFLCHLDNIEDEENDLSDDSGAVVISEDRINSVNEAAEMLSREKFLKN